MTGRRTLLPHSLTAEEFAALGRGGGDTAVGRLVASQRSKHLILLASVAELARRGDRPDDGLAVAGLELLAQAQQADRDAAGEVIGYPSVGACLRAVGWASAVRRWRREFEFRQGSAGRDIPKDATGWDFGFRLQGMVGTDARYTHFLGVADYALSGRYQLDVVEASASVHAPVLQGLDVKAGLYPTPLGFETIDPSTNPFYSHSYIFNFGIPLKHAGVLAVLHATPFLDIYGGVDTGVNTTFGAGDNNGTMGGVFGVGFTLLGGKLTGVALTHLGPENASLTSSQPLGLGNANHYNRFENDAYVTYKWTDTLTTTTEFNYIKDENPTVGAPEAWGIAQYVAYTLTDAITLNARGEIFRDGKGFFVAAFPGNFDFVNVEYGKFNTAIPGPHATYGELTFGATWKPTLPKPISGLLIRPEIRYDDTLAGPRAFNSGKDRGSFTIATDFVLTF